MVFTRPNRPCRMGLDSFIMQVLSFDPSPTYSFEANELEGYEANLSEGDFEFDSDIDSPDEML